MIQSELNQKKHAVAISTVQPYSIVATFKYKVIHLTNI